MIELNMHYVHTIEITDAKILTTKSGESTTQPVRYITLKADDDKIRIILFGDSKIIHKEQQ